ncbi:MAG TPA: EF-Tu/IF-2/RF-3 family GTPase [Candidatus Omnitrophota bacterium]|nr:EF-Tu/IF-2/RF-3 family GTPase [Candidatus Omnitrophota bacterium]
MAKKASSGSRKPKKVVRKKKVVSKAKKPRKASKEKPRKAVKKEAVDPSLEMIGEATHYFPHVNAAAVKIMKGTLHVGDEIYIKGHTTDFKEQVLSIQLDHKPIEEGKKGMEIGLMVKDRVRIGDTVYRIKK